tara:strand:- start:3721 stop:3891 length:171 start_codon:yes stop_codon:yes gene_type:complete
MVVHFCPVFVKEGNILGFDLVGFACGRFKIDDLYIDLSDFSTEVAPESGDNLLVNP